MRAFTVADQYKDPVFVRSSIVETIVYDHTIHFCRLRSIACAWRQASPVRRIYNNVL